MIDTIIHSLPEGLQNQGQFTAIGMALILLLIGVVSALLGAGIGIAIFRPFRYSVSKLKKDNQKNSEHLAIYRGTVEKQFQLHQTSE